MEDLSSESDVCTCKETGAVIEDLQAALLYLQRTPALSAFATDVQAKLQSIQAKKVKVESEAQKHCSGG